MVDCWMCNNQPICETGFPFFPRCFSPFYSVFFPSLIYLFYIGAFVLNKLALSVVIFTFKHKSYMWEMLDAPRKNWRWKAKVFFLDLLSIHSWADEWISLIGMLLVKKIQLLLCTEQLLRRNSTFSKRLFFLLLA